MVENEKLELKETPLEGLPNLNRHGRRDYFKRFGILMNGIQDSKEPTLQNYWIPMSRKSKAGVEYVYYKKILDVVGLKSGDIINKNNKEIIKKNVKRRSSK